jgi:hypothetical protein
MDRKMQIKRIGREDPTLKTALAHEHHAFGFLDKRTGRPAMEVIPSFRAGDTA